MHIILLGGYGGTGRSLARCLLKHTSHDIVIAGHDPEKAESFAYQLQQEFPKSLIDANYVEASDIGQLKEAFQEADLVVVTSTTPELVPLIAEACLETQTDYLDILLRDDVFEKIRKFQQRIMEENRIFICQGGVHPGLVAPMIRYADSYFEKYLEAEVAMAMNAEFDQPKAAHELRYEMGITNPQLLSDGSWRNANWKDLKRFRFSHPFGTKSSYPLYLREVLPLPGQLGLRHMGVYVAGFNGFVDNIVFPMTMMLQSIKKGLGIGIMAKLLHWGIKRFSPHEQAIEFQLHASGLKNNNLGNFRLKLFYKDAYDFTAFALTSCIEQYAEGVFPKGRISLMGNQVQPVRLIQDMEKMGVKVSNGNETDSTTDS
jgi:saccharopine dehydrogenase (NAD+, L-lysine-forming)